MTLFILEGTWPKSPCDGSVPGVSMTFWILHSSYSLCVSVASSERRLEDTDDSHCRYLSCPSKWKHFGSHPSLIAEPRGSQGLSQSPVLKIYISILGSNEPTKYRKFDSSTSSIQTLWIFFFPSLFNNHLSPFTRVQSLNSTHLSKTHVIYAEHV